MEKSSKNHFFNTKYKK